MLALLVVLASLSLTACSDDDEPGQVIYTYGWEGKISGGASMIPDMAIVEEAYATALGVEDSPFILNGTRSECDARVKAACEKVEQTLKDKEWGFTATFAVREQNSNQVVYSYTFNRGSN